MENNHNIFMNDVVEVINVGTDSDCTAALPSDINSV